MLTIQDTDAKPAYDVVVVGSGAAGGQSAYTLTMEGAKVLMLEAGRNYDPVSETPMFHFPSQAPLRDAGTLDKPDGFFDASIDSGLDIIGEPYTNAYRSNHMQAQGPDSEVFWWRSRMLGGRTNHFAKVMLRAGPDDLRLRTLHGIASDWPLSYADLHPYYDKAEMLIGVFGSNDGIDNAPDSSRGVLLPPPKMRLGELWVKKHSAKMGARVVPVRRAVLSVSQDWRTLPARLHPNNAIAQRLVAESMRRRAPCFWATDCARGCSIKANYQSATVHLPPALASGNLDIVCNSMAREITVDERGKLTGLIYVDKTTGQEHRVRARIVVLGASSYESVRILLNSKSNRFPNGIGNTHGLLGRYIHCTIAAGTVMGRIPALESLPPFNDEGSGSHAYIPWWRAGESRAGRFDTPLGFHIGFSAARGMPNGARNIAALTRGAYGKKFKEEQRRYFGSFVNFGPLTGMIPNEKTFCAIDPVVRDKWGIPVLKFTWEYGQLDNHAARFQKQIIAELLDAVGALHEKRTHNDWDIGHPCGNHELGGARMGTAPTNSVTNQFGQVWDVKNVVVSDGAIFPTHPHKNPTLTILALAWRNADHIINELKKGNI